MRKRLNYANVTATLALFFALSGGALAAKHYLINSTKQINPKVLKALKGNVGPVGPIGLPGTPGALGAAGKEGPQGKEGKQAKLSEVKEVRGQFVEIPGKMTGKSVAECPSGTRAISGGFFIEDEEAKPPNFERSQASSTRKGWEFEAGNPNTNALEEIFIEAFAYCAGSGEAVAASRVGPGSRAAERRASRLARLR